MCVCVFVGVLSLDVRKMHLDTYIFKFAGRGADPAPHPTSVTASHPAGEFMSLPNHIFDFVDFLKSTGRDRSWK